MQKFSFKIAFSIILAGLFIVVCFAALNYDNLTTSFYIVSGLVVVFILFFGFAMGSSYAFPVKQLLKKADNIKKGDLKSRLNLHTKDEIEELSKTFNKITDDMEKSSLDMQDFKKSSEIKFKTKDIVSEKIIDALEEKIKNRTADLEKTMAELDRVKEQLMQKDREILTLVNQSAKKKRTKNLS